MRTISRIYSDYADRFEWAVNWWHGLKSMATISSFPWIEFHHFHGLKSMATKCSEPTALAFHGNAIRSFEACRAVGSVDVVAPDFNPGKSINTNFNR